MNVMIFHKRAIEALDRTMGDIKGNQDIMGGTVVPLAGDFRQTLPVITRGMPPADEINASLKASALWVRVKKYCLTTNMRGQLHHDSQAGYMQYAATLLKIGVDRMPTDSNGMIRVSREFCQIVDSSDDLLNNSIRIFKQIWPTENGYAKGQFWRRLMK